MKTIIVCALLSTWGCAHSKTAFRNTYCNENGAYVLGQMHANEGIAMRDTIFKTQCKTHDPGIEAMYRQGYSLGIHRHAGNDTQLKIVLLAGSQSKDPNGSQLTLKELKTPTTASLLDDIRSRYGSETPLCITHQDVTRCGKNCRTQNNTLLCDKVD